jgi:hypothetical protein
MAVIGYGAGAFIRLSAAWARTWLAEGMRSGGWPNRVAWYASVHASCRSRLWRTEAETACLQLCDASALNGVTVLLRHAVPIYFGRAVMVPVGVYGRFSWREVGE